MIMSSLLRWDTWFDNLGGSSIPKSPDLPYHLRVLVPGYRVSPRHSMFDYFLDFGRGDIPKIIWNKPLTSHGDSSIHLIFVLPERWLSVHEQHMFIPWIVKHHQIDKITKVDIITQEALIVGNVGRDSIMLFEIPEDDPERGRLEGE